MSNAVFVIRNQLGQYWTRTQEWVDGREPQRLLKLKHHDEALNQLVELSAKDIELRGEILQTETNPKGEPSVEPSAHPTPTLAETAALEAAKAIEDNTSCEELGSHPASDASEPPAAAAVS